MGLDNALQAGTKFCSLGNASTASGSGSAGHADDDAGELADGGPDGPPEKRHRTAAPKRIKQEKKSKQEKALEMAEKEIQVMQDAIAQLAKVEDSATYRRDAASYKDTVQELVDALKAAVDENKTEDIEQAGLASVTKKKAGSTCAYFC